MRLHLHPTRQEALTLDKTGRVLTRWSLTTNPATKLSHLTTPVISTTGYVYADWLIIHGGITGALDGELFAHAHCFDNESYDTNILELRRWQDLSSHRTIAFPCPDFGPIISGLAGSPDGRWLVVGTGFELLFLIDCQTAEVMSYHTIAGYVTTGLTFDPTSTFVAGIASFDAGGSPMLCRLDPVERFVPRLGENKFSSSAMQDHVSGTMALTVLHWLDRSDLWPNGNYAETFGTTAFSPDSRLVIFDFSFDNATTCVVAYEVPSGKRLWGIFRKGSTPHYFIFTPDGSALIFPDESGDLFVYRVKDGTLVQQVPSGFDQPIQALAFDHDGTTLWLMIRDELVQCPHSYKW